MSTQPPGLLSGVRVLDFTQFIAGPVATRLMGELGAEIIKVELAPGGDNARALPNVRDGRSAYFVQHNVGKKSLCIDLAKQPLQSRQMLLIVAAQIMHQAAQCEGTITFEDGRAIVLVSAEGVE